MSIGRETARIESLPMDQWDAEAAKLEGSEGRHVAANLETLRALTMLPETRKIMFLPMTQWAHELLKIKGEEFRAVVRSELVTINKRRKAQTAELERVQNQTNEEWLKERGVTLVVRGTGKSQG